MISSLNDGMAGTSGAAAIGHLCCSKNDKNGGKRAPSGEKGMARSRQETPVDEVDPEPVDLWARLGFVGQMLSELAAMVRPEEDRMLRHLLEMARLEVEETLEVLRSPSLGSRWH
jgi:hypothetical protein